MAGATCGVGWATAADTWENWPRTNAGIEATFVQSPAVTWQTSSRGSDSVLLDHGNGFAGHLVLSSPPGAPPPVGPLTVELLYSIAPRQNINWPEHLQAREALPVGFEARPKGVIRPPVAVATHRINAGPTASIPVCPPRSCTDLFEEKSTRGYSWRDFPPAQFPRYEVRDAGGQVLCRGRLPAFVCRTKAQANFSGIREDLARKDPSWCEVPELPDVDAFYAGVEKIWFTEALLDRLPDRETRLRRLMLTGVQLTGTTTSVERIQTLLHLPVASPRVLAGFLSAESAGGSGLIDASAIRCPAPPDNKGQPPCELPSLLENQVDLFAGARTGYLIWTFACFFIYAVGVGAILVRVFGRRKGAQRMTIWRVLPGWTLICSALVLVSGFGLLDRRDKVDCTEYRLAKSDWPEQYCQAYAQALTFAGERTEWRLPPPAHLIHGSASGNRDEMLDGQWHRRDSFHAPDEQRITPSRYLRGAKRSIRAGWFEPVSLPVALVPLDAPEGDYDRAVQATEPVDGVWVLARGRWHELGAMQAGEQRLLTPAQFLETKRFSGLPERVFTALDRWCNDGEPHFCTNPDHHHDPAEQMARWSRQIGHPWVVVAFRRDVAPRVQPVWPRRAQVKGRVAWVTQWN